MIKDLDKWNDEKKIVEEKDVNRRLYFRSGEVWWCSAGLNIGREIDGKHDNFERPVLVLKKFNSEMFWSVALSSKEKVNKFYFKLEHDTIKSQVVLSQIKTMSTKRLLRKLGTVSKSDFHKIITFIINELQNESPLSGAFSEA